MWLWLSIHIIIPLQRKGPRKYFGVTIAAVHVHSNQKLIVFPCRQKFLRSNPYSLHSSPHETGKCLNVSATCFMPLILAVAKYFSWNHFWIVCIFYCLTVNEKKILRYDFMLNPASSWMSLYVFGLLKIFSCCHCPRWAEERQKGCLQWTEWQCQFAWLTLAWVKDEQEMFLFSTQALLLLTYMQGSVAKMWFLSIASVFPEIKPSKNFVLKHFLAQVEQQFVESGKPLDRKRRWAFEVSTAAGLVWREEDRESLFCYPESRIRKRVYEHLNFVCSPVIQKVVLSTTIKI